MRISVIIVFAMLATGGCVVAPKFKVPDTPQEATYTRGSSNAQNEFSQHFVTGAAEHEWWRVFRSEEINALVAQAARKNKSLAAASAALAESRELVAAQLGTRYPQVVLSGSTGRQKYGAQFLGPIPPPPAFSYIGLGASINYVIDYTGGVAHTIEQQRALAEVERQRMQAAYLNVTGGVVREAIHVAFARAQLQTAEELLNEDRRNVELVQSAFEAGAVTKVDVLSAQTQLANDETVLPPLKQQLSVAQHALAVLVAEAPGAWEAPSLDLQQLTLPNELPITLPSELAHQRPDILSSEANLRAATAAVGIANSDLYPRINLSASIGQQALDANTLFNASSRVWNLIGGITAPLFDGGTLRAKRRATLHALDASAANYQQTVLKAFEQVADAMEALDHDAESLAAQSRALQAAEQNVDLTRRSYKEGNIGVLQVLDAERLYQQARLGFVRAQAQRFLDTTELFLALGGSPLDETSRADRDR